MKTIKSWIGKLWRKWICCPEPDRTFACCWTPTKNPDVPLVLAIICQFGPDLDIKYIPLTYRKTVFPRLSEN